MSARVEGVPIAGRGPRSAFRWIPALLVGLVLMGGPEWVLAQSGQRGGDQELTREEMQARILEQFERQLSRELGIDAETRAEVHEILAEMRVKRGELFHRKHALSTRMKRFYEEGGSQRDARRLLSEAREVRSMEARIASEEEARLLEVMSPRQVLQFQVIRDEFNQRIRQMQMHRGDSLRFSGLRLVPSPHTVRVRERAGAGDPDTTC